MGFPHLFFEVILFQNSTDLREIARTSPLGPTTHRNGQRYLSGAVPHRGKRNEPAFIVDKARKLRRIKRAEPLDQIAEITSSNLKICFKLNDS
ncbi:MAG: TatD family hydrolase [Acidobacteria bacterium]|nr:TatD family hydrolase [Acidobacteriota bacterium]